MQYQCMYYRTRYPYFVDMLNLKSPNIPVSAKLYNNFYMRNLLSTKTKSRTLKSAHFRIPLVEFSPQTIKHLKDAVDLVKLVAFHPFREVLVDILSQMCW